MVLLQVLNGHPDRNVDAFLGMIWIGIGKLFARSCAKLTADFFDQEINMSGRLPKMDFSHLLLDGNLHTQLFQRFTDGTLMGGFALIHAASGEHEIIQAGAVTLDQRDFVIFNENDTSTSSHKDLKDYYIKLFS